MYECSYIIFGIGQTYRRFLIFQRIIITCEFPSESGHVLVLLKLFFFFYCPSVYHFSARHPAPVFKCRTFSESVLDFRHSLPKRVRKKNVGKTGQFYDNNGFRHFRFCCTAVKNNRKNSIFQSNICIIPF